MRLFSLLTFTVGLSAITASAADPCDDRAQCGPGCKPACGNVAYECVMCCRPECKKEKVTEECFEVECEYICVPPIRLPKLCCLFGGCEHDTCPTAACEQACIDGQAQTTVKFPWQRAAADRDCRGCGDRIRKIHKLKKEERDAGEKCVVEWKVECVCRAIKADSCAASLYAGDCAANQPAGVPAASMRYDRGMPSASPTGAVIGASQDRSKWGNISVREHLAAGYDVYPVNPHESEVEGRRCYASVRDVPAQRLDRVTLYVPPNIGLTLLDDIAAVAPREVWLNPGAGSPAIRRRAAELGLNIIEACSIVALHSER